VSARSGPVIDPFRSRQVPYVAGQFQRMREGHQRQADLMWLGVLVTFSDHDLRLLNDLGFLCQHDLDLLRRAGREPFGSQP